MRARPPVLALAFGLAGLTGLVATGCSGKPGGPADAGPTGPTTWQRGLTETSNLATLRGLHPVRGIMHLHSPYSHDACDGNGYLGNGKIDESCLQDLRDGACTTKQDFLMLTDHPSFMGDQPFTNLLLMRKNDVMEGDHAAWWICPDGHRVLVQAGFEGSIMAFALHHHIDGAPAGGPPTYGDDTAAFAATLRAAGAIVAKNHPEEWPLDQIRALEPDATEIYNLHANVDPRIRPEYLGVSSGGALAAMAPFIFTPDKAPIPDLAFLGFFRLFDAEVGRWQALSLDRPTLGFAATDAHENVLPDDFSDGERGDSYRRLMRWFSNTFYIQGKLTPDSLRAALDARRGYIAYEIFCTPEGVDLHTTDGTTVSGIGSVVQAKAGLALHASMPTCHGGWAQGGEAPSPTITIYRVTGTAHTKVVHAIAVGATDVDVAVPGPGVYYEEVDLVPTHLTKWLGPTPDPYLHGFPWVITNAITVQ